MLTCLIAVGALSFSAVSESKAELDEERTKLASVYPELAKTVDVGGFEMNILCDTNAEPLFDSVDTSDDEMLRGVTMRNAHLESESGATVKVTVTDDFYNTAKNDILSGEYEYDLYAATAQGELSRLLSDGVLYDVSKSAYIDLSDECYGGALMDSLSVCGGQYLISSAAADARWWSSAVAVGTSVSGVDVMEDMVRAGEFTVDAMLGIGNIAYDDIYPLYFGVGGSFAESGADSTEVISHSAFGTAVQSLAPFAKKDTSKEDVFSVKTLYELRSSTDVGILPLPKASAEAKYSGYIDLEKAVLVAIPSGSPDREKTEYLFDRMASLSAEYVAPYFGTNFTDDADMYGIITESASCDLSVLFGYGDLSALVAECMLDDTHLTLEYYNRKALYEKAISIIAKRLCIEE